MSEYKTQSLQRKIQWTEWRWVVLYAVFLMLLLAIPYWVGFSKQTTSMYFSGGIIGIDDNNTYLAKMNQGANGAWLFKSPYSSEPQNGAPIYWFYLLLGKISGTNFINRIVVFHMARSILGVGFILTLYLFMSEILPQVDQRRMSILMVTLGGGLGWLMILSGIPILATPPPLEFYSPEAFSFLMLLTLPHLLLARILMFLSILMFFRHRFVWSGLLLVVVCLIHPADVVILWSVFSLATVIRLISRNQTSYYEIWGEVKPVLTIIAISAPILIYIGYLFLTDPILSQWSTQSIVISPNPLHFIFSYGIYLIFSILGLKVLREIHPEFWEISIAWIVLIPILIYIPVGLQRRLIEGFQVPLVVLTTLGIRALHRQFQRRLIPLTFFTLTASSLILFIGSITSVLYPAEPAFRSTDELAVYRWLDKNAQPGQIILGAYQTGNMLPAQTFLTPFIGHNMETAFFAEKMPLVVAFYKIDTSDPDRLLFIKSKQIDYIFWGPHERKLGNLDPANLAYLVKRFEQGDYSVYEVLR